MSSGNNKRKKNSGGQNLRMEVLKHAKLFSRIESRFPISKEASQEISKWETTYKTSVLNGTDGDWPNVYENILKACKNNPKEEKVYFDPENKFQKFMNTWKVNTRRDIINSQEYRNKYGIVKPLKSEPTAYMKALKVVELVTEENGSKIETIKTKELRSDGLPSGKVKEHTVITTFVAESKETLTNKLLKNTSIDVACKENLLALEEKLKMEIEDGAGVGHITNLVRKFCRSNAINGTYYDINGKMVGIVKDWYGSIIEESLKSELISIQSKPKQPQISPDLVMNFVTIDTSKTSEFAFNMHYGLFKQVGTEYLNY